MSERYFKIVSVYNGHASFLSDNEKMHDFITLSMDEFLESYSYLTEGDYYATYDDLMELLDETFLLERIKERENRENDQWKRKGEKRWRTV